MYSNVLFRKYPPKIQRDRYSKLHCHKLWKIGGKISKKLKLVFLYKIELFERMKVVATALFCSAKHQLLHPPLEIPLKDPIEEG